MNCLKCRSVTIRKNGHIHTGRQNHLCRNCGRQFAEGIEKKTVSGSEKNTSEKFLIGRIALRGICRAGSLPSVRSLLF